MRARIFVLFLFSIFLPLLFSQNLDQWLTCRRHSVNTLVNEWMLKCGVSTLCGWLGDFIPTTGTHYQEIQPDGEIFILKSWWVEYKGKCVFLWLLFLFMRCVSRRFARCFLSLFINRGSGSILWCLFSRKERSVSLNFPGHLHQTAVRQPIHLGSFDLEKYLQQTFSVAKKSTDFLKFFLCSIPEWKEPRVKCHIIGFSESGIIWPEWIDSCNLHLQGPGGILC